MASQLVWTLTSSSYGSASLQAVKLEVNGKTDHGPIERLDQSLSAFTRDALQNYR